MRQAAVFSLFALTALAQQAAVNTPQTNAPEVKPEDLASLEGQVFDAATGSALRKANIVLRRTDAQPTPGVTGFSTSTDDSGKFAMKNLEPGRYRLTATRSGYVNGEYGARGPGRQGTTINLDRAQHLTDLTVKLTPQGVVIGRIVDRDGEPVQGVTVQLLRFVYRDGRKQLQNANVNSTNDLGEYRIYSVAPGRYYLSATFRGNGLTNATQDRSANPPPAEDYVPIYYPGVFDASTASDLTVTAGAQVRADMMLDKARTTRISGRVVNTVGDPGFGFSPNVFLIPRGNVLTNPLLANTLTKPDGTFEIRSVVPGSYYVVANLNVGGRQYSARVPVDAAGGDIENLSLSIGTGLTINGRLRIDGDSTFRISSFRVTLGPREGGIVFGALPNPAIQDDGTFRMEQVNPDVYNVNVLPLPDGFYVKSIRAGDTDVMLSGLDLVNGAPADLDIVLSPNAATVAGTVQDPKTQQPMPGATVVLIPQAAERRNQQGFYKTATTDQMGGFSLKSVPPGDYKLYAWEDVETGAYFDPEFVKPFETKGETISLKESAQLTEQLTAIPAQQ